MKASLHNSPRGPSSRPPLTGQRQSPQQQQQQQQQPQPQQQSSTLSPSPALSSRSRQQTQQNSSFIHLENVGTPAGSVATTSFAGPLPRSESRASFRKRGSAAAVSLTAAGGGAGGGSLPAVLAGGGGGGGAGNVSDSVPTLSEPSATNVSFFGNFNFNNNSISQVSVGSGTSFSFAFANAEVSRAVEQDMSGLLSMTGSSNNNNNNNGSGHLSNGGSLGAWGRGPPLDLYSRHFAEVLRQETAEREMEFRFRQQAARLPSAFASERIGGLTALATMLDDVLTEAALAQAGKRGDGTPLTAAEAAEAPLLAPFDAIRAEVLSGTMPPAPVWRTFQRALRAFDVSSALMQRTFTTRPEVTASLHSGQPVSITLPAAEALAWSTLPAAPPAGARPPPNASNAAAAAKPQQQQQPQQQAAVHQPLHSPSPSSPPREDGNNNKRNMGAAGVAVPGGPHAKPGSGLPPSLVPSSLAKSDGGPLSPPPSPPLPLPSSPTPPSGLSTAEPVDFSAALTAVTYAEQELALRVLQGLCLSLRHQRKTIVDTVVLPMAAGALLCLTQHTAARAAEAEAAEAAAAAATARGRSSASRAEGRESFGASSRPSLGENDLLHHPHHHHHHFSNQRNNTNNGHDYHHVGNSVTTTTTTAAASGPLGSLVRARSSSVYQAHQHQHLHLQQQQQQQQQQWRDVRAAVELCPGQEGVLLAFIDVAEAACHYNPPALGRLVQCGGVRIFLNTAADPRVPPNIRIAILDMFSVLMQQVAPLRKTVAAGGGGGGGETTHADPAAAASAPSLLQAMIQQAVSGTYAGYGGYGGYGAGAGTGSEGGYGGGGAGGGGAGGSLPPTFRMDRASGSKFDSAVREWFSLHSASHLVKSLVQLRLTALPADAVVGRNKAERARGRQRAQQIREKKMAAILQALDDIYREEAKAKTRK